MQCIGTSHRFRLVVCLAILATAAWCPLAMAQATQPAEGTPSGKPSAVAAPASQPEEPAEAAWPPGLIMEGFDKIGLAEPMNKIGLRFYGFVETGFTGRLTGDSNPLFGRVFDARRPNNLRLNQLVLTLDRPYDSSKQFDAGFRVDGLYGGDALLSRSLGLLPYAGSGTGDNWADLPQLYGQLWFKTGDNSGLELTVGKFLTPIGYEALYAPNTPLYSRSFLYGYAEPISHTGVKANYVFCEHASAYFGIVNGWDNFRDNNHAHSYMAGFALSGKEQIDGHARDTFGFNMITGPEQTGRVHNYRTLLDMTATHWWTAKLSSGLTADWGTEKDVGGFERANWYGVAHYLTYIVNPYVTTVWRAEWFKDDTGVRIGTAGSYVENTLGLALTPWSKDRVLKNVVIRPELRWDTAEHAVFDGRFNQLTAAVDVIVKF
jgi:hypothetical protein